MIAASATRRVAEVRGITELRMVQVDIRHERSMIRVGLLVLPLDYE